MLKSQPLSLLLMTSGVACAIACSDGGTDTEQVMLMPMGGTAGVPATGGMDPGVGGGDVGMGGAGVGGAAGGGVNVGGSGGGVDMGGSGGGVDMGGAGGGDMGGAGGGDMGGAGGDDMGGAGGEGGAGEDPNKIVLFDGTPESFNNWISVRNGQANPWKNNGDGTMTVVTNTGDIISKETFQDVFVHIEYVTPRITSAGGGQERGNSGIYLKGSYEVQVLDTYGLPPAIDGCGAIYGVSAPLVVACHQEEVWNTYEIEFKAQVCENGQKTQSANFPEVKLNDMVVQQNVAVDGVTQAGQPESCDPKGLLLQDHSSILPVSYRNIWVIPR